MGPIDGGPIEGGQIAGSIENYWVEGGGGGGAGGGRRRRSGWWEEEEEWVAWIGLGMASKMQELRGD